MAKTNVCDGCQKVQGPEDEFKVIGIVAKRDYCPECAAIAEQYMKDRDDLHDKVQKEWTAGIKKLNSSYKGKLNAFPA